jgi:translation initiation factor IF-3
VRLIGADGEQLGIIETAEALKRAQEADLDLVEVAPNSKPPVTRLLDYSKYKYEQEQKQKAARKHQQQVNVREIKLRPKIANHDYETKKGHVERFLRQQNKVKITIMFRGREQAHPERGRALLRRLFEDLDGIGVIESEPLQEGRNMSMMLAPAKGIVLKAKADQDEAAAAGAPEEGSAQDAAEGDTPDAKPSGGGPSEAPDADGSAQASDASEAGEPSDAAEARETPDAGGSVEPTPDDNESVEAKPAKAKAAKAKTAKAKPAKAKAKPAKGKPAAD